MLADRHTPSLQILGLFALSRDYGPLKARCDESHRKSAIGYVTLTDWPIGQDIHVLAQRPYKRPKTR